MNQQKNRVMCFGYRYVYRKTKVLYVVHTVRYSTCSGAYRSVADKPTGK